MDTSRLRSALDFRLDMMRELDPRSEHHAALRLFNCFTEGKPNLAVDLYGRTLVIFDYAQAAEFNQAEFLSIVQFYRSALPWLSCALLKTRRDKSTRIMDGTASDEWVEEFGVRYAIDLTLHQDATLYLDTRLLRRWLIDHMPGKHMLNTFAYTGSLGAAALSAGAARLVQTDLDRAFLSLAHKTCTLNGWLVDSQDFIAGDFFSVVASLKRQDRLFDCVVLDPPFFSGTSRTRFDINTEYARLMNKIRPLVAHNGWLVAVNNALFVSGAQYMSLLEEQCAGGYLSIENLLPVPADFTGPGSASTALPTDPAPFNHSTKIAVLRVKRKDGQQAT